MWFERLAARPCRRAWLGFATSQFDVAVISLGFVSFIVAGRPIVASNSLVHYTMYFVALAGTGLRYDPRVCLAAGGAALLQYGAIVAWVGLRYQPAWTASNPSTARSNGTRRSAGCSSSPWPRSSTPPSWCGRATFWLDSMRDPLTGLFNRGFFDESFARLVADQRDAARPFTVALIDLDDFKSVNDRYGHRRRRRGAALRRRPPARGFRDEDIIARYGGEEFAVILQADRAAAVAAARRLARGAARRRAHSAAVGQRRRGQHARGRPARR